SIMTVSPSLQTVCPGSARTRLLDLRPAGSPQQDIGARAHKRNRCAGLAGPDGTQDVDARRDRAVVVGRPAYQGKDAAGSKGQDTPTTIEDLLRCDAAEADPMLDLLCTTKRSGEKQTYE